MLFSVAGVDNRCLGSLVCMCAFVCGCYVSYWLVAVVVKAGVDEKREQCRMLIIMPPWLTINVYFFQLKVNVLR